MTVQWQKVHDFISSTFNDMHAERDYLVKRIFPELADWCERRKLRLVDVDLRWGVTEAAGAMANTAFSGSSDRPRRRGAGQAHARPPSGRRSTGGTASIAATDQGRARGAGPARP